MIYFFEGLSLVALVISAVNLGAYYCLSDAQSDMLTMNSDLIADLRKLNAAHAHTLQVVSDQGCAIQKIDGQVCDMAKELNRMRKKEPITMPTGEGWEQLSDTEKNQILKGVWKVDEEKAHAIEQVLPDVKDEKKC